MAWTDTIYAGLGCVFTSGALQALAGAVNFNVGITPMAFTIIGALLTVVGLYEKFVKEGK